MTQGRLYKSARAEGSMADEAILALPERAWPQAEPPAAAQNIADAPGQTSAEQGLTQSAVQPTTVTPPAAAPTRATPESIASASTRPDVSDYDHIFATPDLTFVEPEEDLFPWETPTTGSGSTAAAMPPVPPAAAPSLGTPTPLTTSSAAASPSPTPTSGLQPRADAQPTRISVDGPRGMVEGTNNPVSTYLARAPKIRLTFSGAAAAIMTVTIGLGLVEAMLSDHIGVVTAVLSVATALVATWLVSERDRTTPALLLPIAWLICALLPGQFTAPPTGSIALKQIVVVLGVLGDNALAIIIGTLACYILAKLRPRLLKDPLP